jgi:hypothetical protein
MKTRFLAALSAFFSLTLVGAGAEPDSVAVLVMDNPADCVCTGTADGAFTAGGGGQCGNPVQPCFLITSESVNDAVIDDGACNILGEPPCSAEDCVYPGWEVKIKVSSCANGGACGTAPWQAYLPSGSKYGNPLNPGDSLSMPLTLGNQACRTKTSYAIEIRSSNSTVGYAVTARCGKCPRDSQPLPGGF